MRIETVFDPAFVRYGRVLEGLDPTELLAAMEAIPMPDSGTRYRPGIPTLEACGVFRELGERVYGGMPIQLGMCWGYNTRLNCLEYHRDSEINLGDRDFVLLLASRGEIVDWRLDTDRVRAFRVPAGTAVELYASTLHFAPCRVGADPGFRVAVALPLGTNTERPEIVPADPEDRLLWARNKWLLAHPDSAQARRGAWIGLEGENPDLSSGSDFDCNSASGLV